MQKSKIQLSLCLERHYPGKSKRNHFVKIKWLLSIINITINGHSIYSVSHPTLKFLSSCTHFKSTSSSGSLAPAGPQPMRKSCMLRSAPLSAWIKKLSLYPVHSSYCYANKSLRIKMSGKRISKSLKSCRQSTHMHTPATRQLTNSNTHIYIIHRQCLDTTWQTAHWLYYIAMMWSNINWHAA